MVKRINSMSQRGFSLHLSGRNHRHSFGCAAVEAPAVRNKTSILHGAYQINAVQLFTDIYQSYRLTIYLVRSSANNDTLSLVFRIRTALDAGPKSDLAAVLRFYPRQELVIRFDLVLVFAFE